MLAHLHPECIVMCVTIMSGKPYVVQINQNFLADVSGTTVKALNMTVGGANM